MATVNTVLGAIAAEALGLTLMREHVLFGLPGWEYDHGRVFDRAAVYQRIKADLQAAKAAGLATLVDGSGLTMGRDLPLLQTLSAHAGVQIVASAGFPRPPMMPGHFLGKSPDYYAQIFAFEVCHGMGQTRLRQLWEISGHVSHPFGGFEPARAGIICVSGGADPLPALEEAVIRGAARAARITGAPVHARGSDAARAMATVMLEEGVDPGRVVLGHLDGGPLASGPPDPERDIELARQGFNIAYDRIGWTDSISDEGRVELVQRVLGAGLAGRLVLSTTAVGHRMPGPGPKHRYVHLLESFVPRLRAAGVGQAELDQVLRHNPSRILAMG